MVICKNNYFKLYGKTPVMKFSFSVVVSLRTITFLKLNSITFDFLWVSWNFLEFSFSTPAKDCAINWKVHQCNSFERCYWHKTILQKSSERVTLVHYKTGALKQRVSALIKLQVGALQLHWKRNRYFPVNFLRNFQEHLFHKNLPTTTSASFKQ